MLDDYLKQVGKYINTSRALEENPNPQKAGGFLTIAFNDFLDDSVKWETNSIGEIPGEKIQKYQILSQEKAHRLYACWLRDSKIVSSWQTRDPEKNKWGGAVLFPSEKSVKIISFSGLAESVDEAVSLMFGMYLGKTRGECEKIAKISNNKVFYAFLAKND